ncbi:hypothetical protein IE53DRAFT_411992 [Violaceomyces palustris]|uniref:Uncharacterized protein n=1 Tax=Violaceomyces palustris TaxID=1673888 RepID=A0ACD0NSV5_9BASI|nr:hypothetical protein IE53DRAFT_411992 [Violaceomyces palustris]
MAQGFKASKPSTSKSSSGKAKAKAASKVSLTSTKNGPKRGPRVIPPKKQAAVNQAKLVKKNTASLTSKIESEMATRAASGGPLTIMKKAADVAASTDKKKSNK